MTISILVAIAYNGVIGNNNKLIWHIPEDLKRFKQITTGHTIIMGRKTFESIGKALPSRQNIVLSRQPGNLLGVDGVEVVSSLEHAFKQAHSQEVFVIGGAEIYAAALPVVHKLYITHVRASYQGDCYFPPVDWNEWSKVHSAEHPAQDERPGYEFADYIRRG